jgi:hypothetical protein|nr:hypothetical protein [Kofleriaceae bacterium]
MVHRHGRRILWAACLAGSIAGVVGCDKGGLSVPDPEVGKPGVTAKLPPVPDFALPATTDGSHSVKELHVRGHKLLDQDVTVKGVITWAYDCATAVRNEGESDKDVQARIDDDPTICQRAKFYIGDSADIPPEKSLWVVDVPRPYNKKEIANIKKEQRTDPLKCEPNEDPKKNICPPYKVGDQVEITGKFSLSSPHGDANSDGVLIYEKLKNVTENWPPEGWAPPPPPAEGSGAAGGPPPAGSKPSPEDLVKHKP